MCLECGDLGILVLAPEGEIAYCEACAKGLVKALRELGVHLEADAALLDRERATGTLQIISEAIYRAELAEYDRLRALLREMRREDEDAQAVFEDVA